MIVTIVSVKVKPEFLEAFMEASLENHRNSIQEAGNLRFDILQNKENPEQFTLYEAYESEEAAAHHKTTAHYAIWRDTVADWMAEPRVGVAHSVLAPADKKGW